MSTLPHLNKTKIADLGGTHTMHSRWLVIFNINRWHCRSCSLWPLWYYIFNWRGRGHTCRPLVNKPWTLSRLTKLHSARETCVNIKPHWSVKLINISFVKTAIKVYFQLLTEKLPKNSNKLAIYSNCNRNGVNVMCPIWKLLYVS